MIQNVWGQLRNLNNQGVLSNLMAYGIGQRIFLDPANGNDNNDGMAPTSVLGSNSGPVATLTQAYSLATAGNNDMIILMSNGATTSTARLSATFTWAKNETHLIGWCAPVIFSQRARIAPPTTLAAAAGTTPFFIVNASGCMFVNIEWFVGFSTGQASQLGVTITNSHNWFKNCHFGGIGDATSAASTGSRSLKIGPGDENLFEDCVVGLDTVSRSVANASLELTGGAGRNAFRRCEFPFFATNSGVLGILGTGAACCDRVTVFDDCSFTNCLSSGGATTMTCLASFTSASPGGLLMFKKSMVIGITKWGDTNGLANSYIDMAAISASAGGLGINPS